jgi:hypothetical protein
VLFDCPGQVECYTHHESLRNIFYRIQKLGYRVGFPILPLPCYIQVLVLTGASLLAGSAPSDGLVQLDAAIAVHLDASAFSESYAPDGSPTPQRSDENR